MSLLAELRRRNVFRVAAAYLIVAWLILQVADVLISLLELPQWAGRLTFFILLLGFPFVLLFSWAYELTPEGLKREQEVDRSRSITVRTGRKLNLIIIGLMAIAITYFAWDKFVLQRDDADVQTAELTNFERSVAVMPFASKGDDEESEFFAEGIHDDLLTQLAKVAELHVISRTSVREYASTTKNMRQIGHELSVKHIVEGGVQKVGARVRINAQLIDAETDKHLWAETFDRELTMGNIFEIQSEIARNITGALHATLSPETADAIAKVPTENVEAYRDYLAGMKVLNDPDMTQISARELFESAVEKDPQFALAWVQLADIWQQIYWFDPDQPDAIDRSVEALRRAEELDPDLPEIHLVRGKQQYHGYLNYEEALRELELAERGLPGNAEVYWWRGIIYRHMGRMPEALVAFEQGLRLDPRNPSSFYEYGRTLETARRYEDARALFENAITMFPDAVRFRWLRADVDWYQHGDASGHVPVLLRPDWPRTEEYQWLVARNAWVTGDIETALVYSQRAIDVSGLSFFMTAEELKGGILEASGDIEGARRLFEVALARTEEAVAEYPDDVNRLHALARVHAFLGHSEEAIRISDEVLEEFEQRDRKFVFEDLRHMRGQILCQAGALQAAESEFRWVLSRLNSWTLASLVNEWPPCKAIFMDTENYRRLQEEFGHLSDGVTGP